MNVNTRFQVVLRDNSFEVKELPKGQAEEGAIDTLKKIQLVLLSKRPYLGSSPTDPLSSFEDSRKRIRLGNIAHLIMEAYLEKAQRVCQTDKTQQDRQFLQLLGSSIETKVARERKETVEMAKALGCNGYNLTLPKAFRYIQQFFAEFSIAQQHGFATGAEDAQNLIQIGNQNRDSLLHFAAEFNLVQVIKFAFQNLQGRSLINRKVRNITPLQVAERHQNQKTMKLLLKNKAQIEEVNIAFIMPPDIWREVFFFLTEKELCLVSRVSKAWRVISCQNNLWDRFYKARFSGKEVVSPHELNQIGYLKSRCRNFVENIGRGLYTEEVIPYQKGPDREEKFKSLSAMLVGDHLFVIQTTAASPQKISIDVHMKTGSSYQLLKTIEPLSEYYALAENLCGSASGDVIQLEEASSSTTPLFACWQLPDMVAYIASGGDRIFAQTRQGDLYVIGAKKENGEFQEPQHIPYPGAFRGAAKGFLLLQQHDLRVTILEADPDGLYTPCLEIEEYTDRFPEFHFYTPPNGPLILARDAKSPNNSRAVTIWELAPDSQNREWTNKFHKTGVKLLAADGDTFILGEYPSRGPDKTKLLRSISTWHRAENSYIEGGKLKEDLTIYLPDDSAYVNPLGVRAEEMWGRHYTFAIKDGFVAVINQFGDQFYFDSKSKTSHTIRIPLEQKNHIKATRKFCESWDWTGTLKPIYWHWVGIVFQRTIPRQIHKFSQVGFTSDGDHLFLDDNRGVVIRKFTVSKNEILEDIARGFFSCPSLTSFQHGEEMLQLIRLYNRFYRIDDATKTKIYSHLAEIILDSISVDLWNFFDPYHPPKIRNEVAFFNGSYKGAAGPEYKSRKYSASKERVVQAIRDYIKGNEKAVTPF